jgi:hypothetical protein
MTADFINPTTSGHQPFDDVELAAEGVGPEVLDVRTKDVGVIVLAQPKATKEEYVDAGLTIVLVNDKRHDVCPDTPHTHDHAPIASGRLTYSKAMNLANALIQMCIPMMPLDKTEEGIVVRINEIMEQHQRDAESVAHTESRGGYAYNVI